MSKIPLGERIALRRAQDTADERYEAAARAMLRALEWIKDRAEVVDSEIVSMAEAAIEQAEAAGITTGEDK